MKPRSLLSKVRLLVATGLLGFGLMVSLAVWATSRNAVEHQVQTDVRNASNYLTAIVSQKRAELDLQATLVAEQPALRAIAADPQLLGDTATLTDRLNFYKAAVKADGLAFYNSDGHLVGRVGKVPLPLPAVDMKSLRSPDELPSKRQSALFTHSEGFLLASTRAVKVGAQVIGVVTAFTLVGSETTRSVARSLGVEVAFKVDNHLTAFSTHGLAALPTGSGFHTIAINGQPYGCQIFAIPAESQTGQLSAAVLRSESQVTQAYQKLMSVFFSLLPLALVGSMLLAGRFAKGVTRPVDEVVKAAAKLQAGEWPQALAITSTDEVGMLQRVFNSTVTSLRTAQERLLSMIDTDPLTDLINHRKLKELLVQETLRAQELGSDLSILQVDIDRFKAYNETYGFASGDQVIAKIGSLLRDVTPEFAIRSRYGGETFVILLPGCDLAAAENFGEHIRAHVEQAQLGVTVSVGCAQFGLNTRRSEGLAIAAELALARAKQLGRNKVCRFDSVPGVDAGADPFQLHQYMQDASLATIQALAAAVDAKDSYTEGHSRRVAHYARELGEYVGLPTEELELIYRTATLHDVGKIGVPDSILKKPGHLDPEERAVMQTHPVLGEVIVRKAPQLEDTVPGVRHHHEAWDGNGYPDRLKGEDIPFVARILAIADTFDAMTSDRPYRNGLDPDVALSEIEDGAGRQFDPYLAQAFVDLKRRQVEKKAA